VSSTPGEASPKPEEAGLGAVEVVDLETVDVAVIRSLVAPGDVGAFMADALGMVAAALGEAATAPAGSPFARYFSMSADGLEVAAGFPVTAPFVGSGVVRSGELPAGRAAVTTYLGPFEGLEAAWAALRQRIEDLGERPGDDPWEVYFVGPGSGAPETEWRTELVWPLAPPESGGSDTPA